MDKLGLIEIVNQTETWEQAVTRGVNLLVKQAIASPDLATSIINSTKQLGPYYVIMPKVALAHTQVGPYNLKPGISLVVYHEPVKFSDQPHHAVNLVFVLSAVDSNSHMQQLASFAQVMGQPDIVEQILACKNQQDIYAIIKEFL